MLSDYDSLLCLAKEGNRLMNAIMKAIMLSN